MRVFINSIIVQTLLGAYVFWRLWQVLPNKKKWRLPLILVFIVELLIYFTGFIFTKQLPLDILYPILQVGTSWMVFMIYVGGLFLLYDTGKFLAKKYSFVTKLFDWTSVRKRRIYYSVSIILVIAAMFYGNYRFRNPVPSEVNIVVHKKSSIQQLKVAVVTDVHLGYIINKDILKMYVDKILEQKPDLILLVGDIIDHDLEPLVEARMEEELARLKAPYGVYISTGNHEYRLNAEEKIAWLAEKTGLTMLRDTVVKVQDAFYLVGREDDMCPKRKELSDLMTNVDKNYPVIVMNHQPKRLYEETDEKVDLAVFGHTHNGQLFPANILVNMIFEVGHGYKQIDDTHIYVSSGLGLAGPQYRIGTISEIPIINIQFK